MSSAIRRSRTASSAVLSTGCGRWSPRMRWETGERARGVELSGGEALRRLGWGNQLSFEHEPGEHQHDDQQRAPGFAIEPHEYPLGQHECHRSARVDNHRLRAHLAAVKSAEESWGTMGYRVAVVGATGDVGREILNILAERQFPLDEVAAVASSRSTGDEVDFGDSGEMLKVKNLEHFDFTGWDIALFAAGSDVSKIYAPKAAAAGCTVIDNSSLFRWTRTFR